MSAAEYLRPATVADALALKQARGDGAVFAFGMTALQLAWGDAGPDRAVIDLSALDLPSDIRLLPDGRIALPACVTLQAMLQNPVLARHCPMVPQLLSKVAAAGVRNLASLGGNLLWGRGDLEVPFLALSCDLVFVSGSVVPLKSRCQIPGDDILLEAVIYPSPAGRGFVEKLGSREAFSPARAVVAGWTDGRACRFALRLGPGRARVVAADPRGARDALGDLFQRDDDPYLVRASRNLLLGHADALGFLEVA